MIPRNAYLIMRVMVRLHAQALDAMRCDRNQDAHSIFKLIARLEYQIYGSARYLESEDV